MGCKITDEVLFNRQVNYLIIEKFWEYHNKGADKKEFYETLGIDKNSYSRIRTANRYNCVDLEKRWEKKDSRLRKVGLSKEIMTGLKVIETEDITLKDWKDYINYRYDNDKDKNKKENSYRISTMQTFNKNLRKLFDGLKADKKTGNDIGKLFYFIIYGRAVELDLPDAEMHDLKDSLGKVTIEKMKVCDKKLRQEVYEAMKEKYEQLGVIVNYENLTD